MLKKILYVIVIIAVIVILAIMWSDSRKEETAPIANDASNGVVDGTTQTESPESIVNDINSLEVTTGIDTDLNQVDADIKSL
jgi:hypothetical protein